MSDNGQTPVYLMLLLILMFLVYADFGVNHELRGSSSYPESAQNDFCIMARRYKIQYCSAGVHIYGAVNVLCDTE